MKKIDLKKVIGWLGFILRCPICSAKYNLENIKVIESDHNEMIEEARILIHSDCHKCKSSVMFNIDINGPEIFTVAMMTDLTSKDSNKFSKLKPINVNEVIAMHQGLREFDGDWVKALHH
jgi:hypothetical protein